MAEQDQELRAIQRILEILEPIEEVTRNRILEYLISRYRYLGLAGFPPSSVFRE